MEFQEWEKSQFSETKCTGLATNQTHSSRNTMTTLLTIIVLVPLNTSSSVTAQEKGAQCTSQGTFGKSHSFGGSDTSKCVSQS